jgi:hypothetical protein
MRSGLKGGFYSSVGERFQRRSVKEQPPPQLQLPHISKFDNIVFTPAFNEFLAAVRHFPDQKHRYRVNSQECDLEFGFDPATSGWTLNRAVYTQATMLKSNTLWHALNGKRQKLADAKLPGHCGIIVCDGDCDTLRKQGDWDQYGADDIAKEFLRAHRSINFVLILVPKHKGFSGNLSPQNHFLWHELYHNYREIPDWLVPINNLSSAIPQVRNTALNARHELDWRRKNKKWNESPSLAGGMTVSAKQIKISARTLLQLLAGVLKQEQFESEHRMTTNNPFLQKYMNGQLIEKMRIEKDGLHEDDELVVFEFGDPDPAIRPFQAKAVSDQKHK